MTNLHERSFNEFIASCHNLAKASNELALEDARFVQFTELLQIGNIIDNPTVCRYASGPPNQPWGLLGYSWTEEINSQQQGDESLEEDGEEPLVEQFNQLDSSFRYTFIHGFFDDENTLRNAKKSELDRTLKRLSHFVQNTAKKQEEFLVKDEHEIQDLQRHFIDGLRNRKIDRIEFVIITDTIINQEDLPRKVDIPGYPEPCHISYWDLRKWSELKLSKSKRVPVDFSIREMGYKPVLASGQIINADTSCYLTILPGGLVADLYHNFHTRLLESNVRVFLSVRRPTNKAMVETIDHAPDLFLSFNNGLSATASGIKLTPEGGIISIQDFQIVNGGQTTATLYHAKKRLKKDISEVYVQLKLTVIKNADQREKVVPRISKSANTQTAIKKSDFYANHPYLIDLAKLGGKTYYTTPTGINCYYFFERMAGQYGEEKRRQRGVNLRQWENKYPAAGKFDKLDLARWTNILEGEPHKAASSAEKSFGFFIDRVDTNNLEVSTPILKNLVGFGLLFRRARKVCGTKNGKKFPSIIGDSSVALATTIYAMGLLHYITNSRFDYHLLFDQTLSENHFDGALTHIIKQTWKQLEKHGGTSVQEQSKKEAAWTFIKQNIEIDQSHLVFLERHTISNKELEARQQGDPNETERYFQLLQHFFGNKTQNFQALYDQILVHPKWSRYRSEVSNIQLKIQQRNTRITLNRLEKLQDIEKRIQLVEPSEQRSENTAATFNLDIDFQFLYQKLFSNHDEFLKNLEELILTGNEEDFEQHSALLEEVKKTVEDFEAWESLSFEKFTSLTSDLNTLRSI